MAKITNHGPGGGRPPGFKGVTLVYYDPKRGYLSRAWPRYLTRKNTPAEQFAKDQFREAQTYVAQTTGEELDAFKELAKGTPFTWRDLKIMSIYGKLLEFTDQDGNVYRSIRTVSAEIQQDLDSITTTIGAMLIRTTNGWVGLDPGPSGDTLTMDPVTALPTWKTGGSGGGGETQIGNTNQDFANNTYLGSGTYYAIQTIAPAGFTANNVILWAAAPRPLATARPGIYQVTAPLTATLIATGPTQAIPGTGLYKLPLATPLTLTDTTPILIGIQVDTDTVEPGNNNYLFNISFTNTGALPTNITTWTGHMGNMTGLALAT